jgi:hypothetical protein
MVMTGERRAPLIMKLRILSYAVIAFGLTCAARAAIEFTGYLSSKEGTRFILTDLDTGSKSEWLVIGDKFLGRVVAKFDPAAETLFLEQAGATVRLQLKDSRVKDGKAGTAPKLDAKVQISAEGGFSIDNTPADLAAVEAYFRAASESGKHISLAIHEPPSPTHITHEYTKQVMAALTASGAKKWSIKIVSASSHARTDAPTSR